MNISDILYSSSARIFSILPGKSSVVRYTATAGPLHIAVATDEIQGYVQCEKLALLDLTVRRHKKISRLMLNDIINITDAVQGIFDYV